MRFNDRGRRGNFRGGRDRESDRRRFEEPRDHGYKRGGRDRESDRRRFEEPRDHGHKRSRDDSAGPSRRGKFQRRGRGGARGMGKRREKPEFVDLTITRPRHISTKQAEHEAGDKIVKLSANYFKVSSINSVTMKMYNVEIEPRMDNPKLRKFLINGVREELGIFVYDDRSSIYLLKEPPTHSMRSRIRNDDREFKIRLKFCKDIPYTDANFLQILNLIVNQSMKGMKLELIGRNYFDPNGSISIPGEALQLWPGFITSIRKYEQDLLLCCGIAHKVIREETVLHMIEDCKREAKADFEFKKMAKQRLVGQTVLTLYNNKTYRIDDIDFSQNPMNTVSINGNEVTYVDYFRNTYGVQIRHHRQPLLVINPTARNIRGGKKLAFCIPPEICSPVGISDVMKNDFRKMRDLAEKTRMTPQQRVRRLFDFNNRVRSDGAKPLEDHKLNVENKLVEFDGRKLQEQKIIFGENKVVDLRHANNTADWTSNLKDVVLFKPIAVPQYSAYIFPESLRRQSEEFLDKFIKTGRKLGMTISDKIHIIGLHDSKDGTYIKAIQDYIGKGSKFIMIVIPRANSKLYSAIKKASYGPDERNPVPVQVITLKTMEKKGGMSVATKVAIQINCKLGGIPWSLDIPINGLLAIGFSITQDTQNRKEYYGAMVASMKPGREDGKFFSCVNVHSKGSSISEYFGVNVMKAVNRYADEYRTFPERIIIYRDGCGDGQIEYVVQQEVTDVVSKLDYMYSENKSKSSNHARPKLGFVIINKRINTRIFSKQNNSYDNPLPGTVVDDVITLPERYDFYLISQSVTQGTVAPVSYNIVHDDLGLKPKEIQLLSYKMCHLYFNWSGTTRVPSVVQYAQKLAFLFGQHLHFFDSLKFENLNEQKKKELDPQLFFL